MKQKGETMENKKRLIDADEIRKKAVPHTRGEHGYNANIRKWAVLVGDIDDAPTIDAVEVVHGQWVIERSPVEAEFKCSECGYLYIDADSYAKEKYNYCPNCGAKMDGDEDENH